MTTQSTINPTQPVTDSDLTSAPVRNNFQAAYNDINNIYTTLANFVGSFGTMSIQNANNVAITGGAINGTTVGATTPSSGAFTSLHATGNAVIVGTISASNLSGTNTGDQTITLTGDVTGSGTGSFAATIAANAVTNTKLAQMPAHSIKGNNTGGNSNAADLTASQVQVMLGLSGINTGDVTLSGQNYLSITNQVITANAVDLSGANATGTLAAARFPALTGDVTTSAGSLATSIGAGKVTNTMLAGSITASKLVGTDIATVGTITTGTWNATTIAVANGGTGATTANGAVTNLLPTQTGQSGKVLTTNGTVTSWLAVSGTGTVTSVSVTSANGVSGSVATATTTPAITLTLGDITPSSVNSIILSGSATPTLAVTGASTISGDNTGDQTITLTGDVTGTGTGSFATTIGANKVANSQLAQMAAHTYKGNNTGSTANAADITSTQLTADLNLFSATLKGLTPLSGGGTANYLRADGMWTVPPGVVSSVSNSDGTLTISPTSGDVVASLALGHANTWSGQQTFVAPILGAATATTINKVTVTAPATGSTLTIDNGFTLHASGNATVSGSNTGDQTITLTGDVTGSGTGSFTTAIKSSVALAGNPTTTTQSAGTANTTIATTAYTDAAVASAISGVNPAVAVQAATTANVSGYTYNNGVAGVGATLTQNSAAVVVIDGYTLLLNDRVLFKNQSTAANNGVYFISTLGTGLIPAVFTRALDYDQPSDINNTGSIPVVNGTVNALTSWLLTSHISAVGTDSLTYTQFSVNPTTLLSNSLTSANIFVGNASNVATGVAVSGDASISNTGAVTVTKFNGNSTIAVSQGGTGLGTLTAHALIAGNGTSAPNFIAPGTSGNVLTSNGTDWTSAAASSELVLISSATASSSATLDFTSGITSAYSMIIFVLTDIVPATNAANLQMRFSINGGSSYITSGNYGYASLGVAGGSASTVYVQANGASFIQLTGNINTGTPGSCFSGVVDLINPASSTTFKSVNIKTSNSNGGGDQVTSLMGSGLYDGVTTAVNAIRFLASSGNITSGTIYMYGVKNT